MNTIVDRETSLRYNSLIQVVGNVLHGRKRSNGWPVGKLKAFSTNAFTLKTQNKECCLTKSWLPDSTVLQKTHLSKETQHRAFLRSQRTKTFRAIAVFMKYSTAEVYQNNRGQINRKPPDSIHFFSSAEGWFNTPSWLCLWVRTLGMYKLGKLCLKRNGNKLLTQPSFNNACLWHCWCLTVNAYNRPGIKKYSTHLWMRGKASFNMLSLDAL